MKVKSVIGLDWQGVVTDYSHAFSVLVKSYDKCVIITQMKSLKVDKVAKLLRMEDNKIDLLVEICPDERHPDYQAWKVDMCMKHNVDVMFDDDVTVVMECKNRQIPAIVVGRMPNYA